MKKTSLRLAARLGALAGGVLLAADSFALNPTDTESPATIRLYVTGGGASDGNLEQTFKNILNPTSVDTYTYGGDKRNWWAVSGTLKVGTTLSPAIAAGTQLALFKRTNGAAFTATTVPNGTPIEHLKVTAAVETAPGSRVWNLTAVAANRELVVSDAGLSDVPLSVFTSPVNVPSGTAIPKQSDIDTLVTVPINAAPHGIAVSLALRNALQTQQGLVPGSETEANIPSLSRAALASIYEGRISKWSQLVHNGTRFVVPAGYEDKVLVAPRSAGAAAQASINARILTSPNNPTAFGPAPQNLTGTGGKPYVWHASLPGDIDKILDNVDKGTAFSWIDGTGATRNIAASFFVSGKKLAIGSTSVEKNTAASGSANIDLLNYRFIKIDGIAPTLRNVYNGTWPIITEAVIVYRGPSSPGGELTGAKKLLAVEFSQRLGEPAALAANNTVFFHGFGQTGYAALSANGFTVDATFNPANPVTPYTFSQDGTPPDIVRPAVRDLSINPNTATPFAPDLITQ